MNFGQKYTGGMNPKIKNEKTFKEIIKRMNLKSKIGQKNINVHRKRKH